MPGVPLNERVATEGAPGDNPGHRPAGLGLLAETDGARAHRRTPRGPRTVGVNKCPLRTVAELVIF